MCKISYTNITIGNAIIRVDFHQTKDSTEKSTLAKHNNPGFPKVKNKSCMKIRKMGLTNSSTQNAK